MLTTKTVRPRPTDSAKVICVIETESCVGYGTDDDPCRRVIQYWDFDGCLLAASDPCREYKEAEEDQDRITHLSEINVGNTTQEVVNATLRRIKEIQKELDVLTGDGLPVEIREQASHISLLMIRLRSSIGQETDKCGSLHGERVGG